MSPEQIDSVRTRWTLALRHPEHLVAAVSDALDGPEETRVVRAGWAVAFVTRLALVLDRPAAFSRAAEAELARRAPVSLDDLAAQQDALLAGLRALTGDLPPAEEQAWALTFALFREIVAARSLDPFGTRSATPPTNPAGTPGTIKETTMQATETPDYTAIKSTQQQTWSSGDYAAVAARIQHMSDALVEAADLHAGWRVLDVACGSGNATLAAARCDTQVVGVDYVPGLLDVARARAAAERLDIELREGDAEHLPVETGEFDAVISVVGSMFAPNQVQAAKEIARACRSGGTIGLASWSPTSFIAELFKVVSRYAPPPPGVTSPMGWGDESHLQELFGDDVSSMHSVERVHTWRFTTPEALVKFFEVHYGPTLKAFGRQDDADRSRLEADLVELARTADVRRDGRSIVVPATYLQTVCRRA